MVGWLATVDRQTVSNLTGTFSFVVWLFAQSPQLYENYRRGSVDGLSAVFLTQWMLGDATNLIGCILTQQLPFQIAVSTYFCCIDVCIMVQFVYYKLKSRRERARRTKNRSRQRTGSLTSPYPANSYSVLSETSELLGGRASRHNSYLRSSSRRRNLSHSQQLVNPHRHIAQHAYSQHDALPPLARTSTDKADDAADGEATRRRPHFGSSRSRSRHAPPISRTSSTDTVPGFGSGSVANYRALSDAAMSVAQLAHEAARRREAMLHHATDEDYFSHRKPHSHRSKSRASSSPNHSQPSSRSRSRVNSNDLTHPDALQADLAASTQSMPAVQEGSSSVPRKSRATRSMSARRKGPAGQVDFVPSALSPTRESKDADDEDTSPKPKMQQGDDGDQTESASEAESGSESAAQEAMTKSIDSLASVSTESSTGSGPLEPRGRDMVRTANRVDTAPVSGTATPNEGAAPRRDAASSPFSSESSSNGTVRHASADSAPKDDAVRMSQSHHQLGQHERANTTIEAAQASQEGEPKSRKRRTHDSTRESSPAAPLHRSVDSLNPSASAKDGSRKRGMYRTSSSRSHTKQLSRSTLGMTSTTTNSGLTGSSKKRSGTKSPASMRRSIGMVLLGIMMITSLPATSTAAVIPTPSSPLLLTLFDEATSWNRLVGRISAWLCALLYITSRIPQIWENHIRRSVAGLSILLFIAAFTGNLLYTISVLTNPSASGEGSRAYLQESLPFLLGSGGTLVFDLIIVAQWMAWRKKGVALA
ncbi:Cystinosin/ERS1p repeat [Kalmanozyma brasiliensis GHG001]|nr:Cystinosin/ERS1p repeat [Kalmanozyma brasiliensis GHG001]EST07525.2 Cystinosin/ERS1p repeat [Kalmanozyma brasiliensis GHG001]